jgi:hypothetical protein
MTAVGSNIASAAPPSSASASVATVAYRSILPLKPARAAVRAMCPPAAYTNEAMSHRIIRLAGATDSRPAYTLPHWREHFVNGFLRNRYSLFTRAETC